MAITKMLVLFKTHLDVGFTDLAQDVVDRYFKSFIPNAVKTAKLVREPARFVWTTGSWLIHEGLEQPDAKPLEEAIERGDIRWHGLPFTTHTELMDEALFRYGLSLSKRLDERFGRTTIAAKMTDVPGHTKAMIPLLAEAGIEFLHIGVNESCTMPDVPGMFRWRCGSDEITVMYNQGYGDFTPIGDTGTAMYFAHSGDNRGGPNALEVQTLFARLRVENPNAEIVAADLNDVALEVRKIKDNLPVVTQEIGDTWIHGIGSDPERVAAFKALLRFRDTLGDEKEIEQLNRGLLMIPEHTWGLDTKRHLHDNRNYARKKFDKARQRPNFFVMERSWQEQRDYLYDAVAGLESRGAAKLAEIRRAPESLEGAREVKTYDILEVNGYEVQINHRGCVKHLKKDGRLLADKEHLLGRVVYEQFCKEDYDRFFRQYNIKPTKWAKADFQKLGMEKGVDRYRLYKPSLTALYQKESRLIAQLEFIREAYEAYGCPRKAELVITFEESAVTLDFAYFGKPANRMAEAMWLQMNPLAETRGVRKLGRVIDPKDVIKNGNRKLFGTDYGVEYAGLSVEALDSALVAFGEPSLLDFNNTVPDPRKGAWFNLFNNTWGTNFQMWTEGDMRFRFVVRVD